MKRLFDVIAGLFVAAVTLPLVGLALLLVWLQDRHSPFYLAPRVGMAGREFAMIKIRTMVPDADRTGVDSTSSDDARITPVGRWLRRGKIDELTQVWNVLRGEMSFVGPRPNVRRETVLYTEAERRLLTVAPGITDFSSIVFGDLADILRGHADANLAYNQLVRPGKSALGLFYVDHRGFTTDLRLCWLTVVSMFSRPKALCGVASLLRELGADRTLITLAKRQVPLTPMAPPGSTVVPTSRRHGTVVER